MLGYRGKQVADMRRIDTYQGKRLSRDSITQATTLYLTDVYVVSSLQLYEEAIHQLIGVAETLVYIHTRVATTQPRDADHNERGVLWRIHLGISSRCRNINPTSTTYSQLVIILCI